jgi:hypothetical protein
MIRSQILVFLPGLLNSNSIWSNRTQKTKRESLLLEFAIGQLSITMNMLVTVVDWLLLHLLIDATLHLPKLLTFPWEELQLDQLVQVKQRPLKILEELLVFKL